MDQPQTNEEYAKIAFSLVRRDFPDCKLLNLYFWGSRWAETQNEESDWDFLAILDSNYQQPDINNIIQDTNIDILLYEVQGIPPTLTACNNPKSCNHVPSQHFANQFPFFNRILIFAGLKIPSLG